MMRLLAYLGKSNVLILSYSASQMMRDFMGKQRTINAL